MFFKLLLSIADEFLLSKDICISEKSKKAFSHLNLHMSAVKSFQFYSFTQPRDYVYDDVEIH